MPDDINYSESDRPREIHPRGEVPAVCVDVIDLGLQKNSFKPEAEPERRIRIVWETAKKRTNGKHFTVSKTCKLSLYDGSGGGNAAGLYLILSTWLGPSWDGRFNSKDIVGKDCSLFISQEKAKFDKNKTIAKILSVNPLDEGQRPHIPSGDYKRWEEKGDAKKPERADYDDEIGI